MRCRSRSLHRAVSAHLQHLAEGVTRGGADAVLAASIFHYGEFTVRAAKEYMAAQGVEMRLT